MNEVIKAGDIVQLKSGGPDMTVSSVIVPVGLSRQVAYCQWFDGRAVKSDKFLPSSLKVVTSA